MNPVLLGRHVEQGLRELVHSTLNSTSTGFEGAVDRFLENPAHFKKGPWVSIDLPFKSIAESNGGFDQPFPEIPLKFAPYQHQLSAFERLSSNNPQSTLIATGTGSGKTESYLWPILDYCREHSAETGIKAILIFPMNALATDQARRVAEAITNNSSLSGVTAGIYADAEPRAATYEVTGNSIITSREAMRTNPPDILLTNYKMLDYLLLRGDDLPLWAANQQKTLRYLVVDELHTFDGAQGADLALLIRRLKHRLKMPENHLICVGSSATLGSGEESAKELVEYAETIFGEPFAGEAVVRETRVRASDALDAITLLELPEQEVIEQSLLQAEDIEQAAAAIKLAEALFGAEEEENKARVDALLNLEPNSMEFRIELGGLLKQSRAVSLIVEALTTHKGPMSLEALAEALSLRPLDEWSLTGRFALAETVISLMCWARSGSVQVPRPLFNIRLQTWLREMARIVAMVPRSDETGAMVPASLHHADDLDKEELERCLPVVNCQRCGTTAFLGREGVGSSSLSEKLETLYKEYFEDSGADRLRLIYTNKLQDRQTRVAGKTVYPGLLNPDTLAFQIDEKQLDRSDGKIPAWLYLPAATGRMDRTCPACGHEQGLVLFGMRSARLTAGVSSILFSSEQNEESSEDKPRFLMFSDSVQDAAQRSAVTEVRNAQSVVQKTIFQGIQALSAEGPNPERGVSLGRLVEVLPPTLLDEMGNDRFVSAFIPRDQIWRKAYKALVEAGTEIRDNGLLAHVQGRLGWSTFEDFTYKSHLTNSLEGRGIAVADVLVSGLADTVEKFKNQLANESSALSELDTIKVTTFIFGVLQRLRRQGSVAHPYLVRAIQKARLSGYLGWFGAAQTLGWGRGAPIPDARRMLAPIPAGFRDRWPYFANIIRDTATNPYPDWLYRALIGDKLVNLSFRDIYTILFERLVADGWLTTAARDGDEDDRSWAYLLDPERVEVSLDVVNLECSVCQRKDVTIGQNTKILTEIPCGRIGCEGVLEVTETRPIPALRRALTSDRNHRVVAREHTGLLDTDTRLSIEEGFIKNEEPWAPNLISATPTLEMGIDIGDLSTMLLCSVPPEEANYVQRMGRTGRRDGNALNLVLANAKPHDLQFWADPSPMLKGEVRAPGVYIAAESVLLRQITAFTLDAFVAQTKVTGDFGKVSDVRKRRQDRSLTGFPMDWLAFVGTEGDQLADAFVDLLPVAVRGENHRLISRLKDYVTGNAEGSLQWTILQIFDEADARRARLVEKRDELTAEKRKLKAKSAEFTADELQKREDAIEKDRKEINRLIRQGIDDVSVIKFLTDKGILPNYAFPEEGVSLTSLLSRHDSQGNEDDGLYSIEYKRPASSALSEFALGQTFYAEGRQVEISRLDMSSEDLSIWRFCQTCSHAENTAVSNNADACPKCGDDMWSDSGSIQPVIELKSVLAISSEDKAAIRDNDQRIQLSFDRAMLPDYSQEDITAAWYSDDERAIAPFGYELLAQCAFRDFNFGKKEDGAVGPRIAGQNRFSRPFRLCKQCGTKQNDFLGADGQGEHPPSCPVIKLGIEDQEDWLINSFLMREFSTEAIRLIIPVVGEVNHDEIKSFVAGINLGMRRYFNGRVDHIRSAVVEGQIDGITTVRSLFLYDSVPGGSGYLRQLADDSNAMKSVFEAAFATLDSCPCIQEEKTGCYRCVKSYRSQFGPGEPQRDTARNLIESVLQQWDSLKKSKKPLNVELNNTLIRSELEQRFLQVLRDKLGNQQALIAQVVGQGARGFLLSIDGKPSWTIEPQVQMEGRFPGMPRKEIDFLLTPLGNAKTKPIVIETDGIQFHATSVTKDLQDRLQMIRTGLVQVWSLSWHDLQDKGKTFSNPLSNEALNDFSRGMLGKVLGAEQFSSRREAVSALQGLGSLDSLIQILRTPLSYTPDLSLLLRGIVGPGQKLVDLDGYESIREESKVWLEESSLHSKTNADSLDLFIGVDKLHPDEFMDTFQDIRVLASFTAVGPADDGSTSEVFNKAFRGLWRVVNLLQGLPGFHVQHPALDTLDLPISESTETDQRDDEAWAVIRSQAIEDYAPLINALIAAEIPCPDCVGQDVMEGSRVITMAELGWSDVDVWVTDAESELRENIIFWDLTTDSVPAVVASLTKILNRGAEVV